MKRVLLILFCMLALPVLASHIVGGEFELIHISGNQYRLNLILYFDEVNGAVGAKDGEVNARIFRKSDNAVMMDVNLPLLEESNVNYTQPDCAVGELKTRRLFYSRLITLSSASFSDPGGYYVAWERCCRNYDIDNIFSENLQLGGLSYAGQTFYLEFPPVTKNGEPFYNSTPRLFPPLSDFACPRRNYYVDFAGVDDDGDSLVYSLVAPLNTKSGDALPPVTFLPRPKPYPDVLWRPGFSLNGIVGGAPDLAITSSGFLTVTPVQLGLFVFAVKCEEFRNGIKIGEVRRDFQMKVIDGCPVAEPPVILGKKKAEPTLFSDKMNITFANNVNDEDRCIQVQVSDADANRMEDNFSENIKLRAIPLGYKKDMSGILPDISVATLTAANNVKTFDICFDRCPPNESGIFQVGIIAYDDACSLPLSDTLRITVNVQPPFNAKPKFELPLLEITKQTLQEGDIQVYDIKATDGNNDKMIVGIIPDGFSMAAVGMSVNEIQNEEGIYESQLTWDTQCDKFDFTKKTSFQLKFIVQDQDLCAFSGSDTIYFDLNVVLPGNDNPIISTDLQPKQIVDGVYIVERKILESLSFNVTGSDLKDRDYLTLTAQGDGFDMGNFGATFPARADSAIVTSQFNWQLPCDKLNLTVNDEFDFQFIVKDQTNKCRLYKADTLFVRVKALPPDNEKPAMTITNTNPDLDFVNNFQDVIMGQQISLSFISTDIDTQPQDLVRIEMIDATGDIQPQGFLFSDASGSGSAQTTFSWLPDCSIFKDGDYENDYTFTFRTLDSRCRSGKGDTVKIDFKIRDINSENREFIPPNFISANGDSYNEYFAMLRQSDNGQLENILPLDNCVGSFVSISIYNRWGIEVYSSNNRDFQWRPVNQAPGIYFYTLIYSNKEYKGTVTVKD
jgi:hypothetical protein